jgi:hypothetical protein
MSRAWNRSLNKEAEGGFLSPQRIEQCELKTLTKNNKHHETICINTPFARGSNRHDLG